MAKRGRPANPDAIYERYVRDFRIKEAQGYPMQDLLSKKFFLANYNAEVAYRLTQMSIGGRKTVGNVVRDMVNASTIVSSKQAKSFSKLARDLRNQGEIDFKGRLDQKTIRTNESLFNKLKDYIKDLGKDLKTKGMKGRDVAKYIGHTFFGSP